MFLFSRITSVSAGPGLSLRFLQHPSSACLVESSECMHILSRFAASTPPGTSPHSTGDHRTIIARMPERRSRCAAHVQRVWAQFHDQ